jgi:hypothetical protein
MCPTVLGRIQTRTAILIGPALLGLLLWAITGRPGFIVLIGVYLLLGAALDAGFYPLVIKWQPPWLTFVLALAEFVILFILGRVLEVGLTSWQAIWFFWVSWAIAIATRIVVLPIVSLSWVENGGEFRETGWSIAPDYEPFPILAEPIPVSAEPGRLLREFTSVGQIPAELRRIPAPTGVHAKPPTTPA